MPSDAPHQPDERFHRRTQIAASGLVLFVALLICLIPKPENDLFFELRIGSDILHSHRLPHVDTYSWVNRGTRWDVPEWLAFVLFALAFRVGGFFGTWLLMVLLTLTTAWVVWVWLRRQMELPWAFLLTCLMLLALKDCLQERPYAFTYLLLAVSLMIVTCARDGRLRLLFWLLPLCILWTNLHQGVLVLIGLLLMYTLGDALTAAWLRFQGRLAEPPDLLADPVTWQNAEQGTWRLHVGRAWTMLGTALFCAIAGMVSPYGWRVYWNVFITLRNHTLMANVTEWNSAFTLPFTQWQPFLAIAVIVFGCLAFKGPLAPNNGGTGKDRPVPSGSPRIGGGGGRLAEIIAIAALLGEALLHARNIPLFAIGGLVIAAPHFTSAMKQVRQHLGLAPKPVRPGLLAAIFALLCVAALALVSFVDLRKAVGPRGYSPAGIGEAVAQEPSYPSKACAFMEAEKFPMHLRLLNDFEIGGYLMWRLPSEPVFIDGRLDVYVGRTFDDMLLLTHAGTSPARTALLQRYDFDCVLTTNRREADLFAANSLWQKVYSDPNGASSQHCRIFLRRRPEFAALITRCLRDRPISQ